MQHSDTITKIAPDYLAAQKEIEAAVKGSENPYFHSSYADLNSVMDACKKALNDHNIAVIQPVVGDMVETILMHTSGEWFGSETKIVSKQPDPQSQGSAISYARRYGLQSMVFIGSEDDDGEVAMNKTEPKPVEAPKTVSTANKATMCPIHKVEFKTGAYGSYHGKKVGDKWVNCKGFGYPGEQSEDDYMEALTKG